MYRTINNQFSLKCDSLLFFKVPVGDSDGACVAVVVGYPFVVLVAVAVVDNVQCGAAQQSLAQVIGIVAVQRT